MDERAGDIDTTTHRLRELALPWSPAAVADLDVRLRRYVWLWYAWIAMVAASALLLGLHAWADATPRTRAEASGFDADNRRAMDRMMRAMDVAPSGNVDRDFVAMMTPHHQGAIDMAVAELRYGKDETLRRMAQEIIVEQQQEIAAMQLAVQRLPAVDSPEIARLTSELCTSPSMATREPMSHPGGDHQ